MQRLVWGVDGTGIHTCLRNKVLRVRFPYSLPKLFKYLTVLFSFSFLPQGTTCMCLEILGVSIIVVHETFYPRSEGAEPSPSTK